MLELILILLISSKVINRAKQAETNLTDQHKITEAKEKELQEHKEKIKQYEARSVELQQDYNESESYVFDASKHSFIKSV